MPRQVVAAAWPNPSYFIVIVMLGEKCMLPQSLTVLTHPSRPTKQNSFDLGDNDSGLMKCYGAKYLQSLII